MRQYDVIAFSDAHRENSVDNSTVETAEFLAACGVAVALLSAVAGIWLQVILHNRQLRHDVFELRHAAYSTLRSHARELLDLWGNFDNEFIKCANYREIMSKRDALQFLFDTSVAEAGQRLYREIMMFQLVFNRMCGYKEQGISLDDTPKDLRAEFSKRCSALDAALLDFERETEPFLTLKARPGRLERLNRWMDQREESTGFRSLNE